MPSIITETPSDTLKGEINISDVHKLINDFITKVNLECIDPARNPVQKHYYFDISLERIKKVLQSNGADSNTVRINLVLNLPNQLNCFRTDSIENYLSILVCGVSANGTSQGQSLLNIGDHVLAEGFRDNGAAEGSDCCVQGHPPYS